MNDNRDRPPAYPDKFDPADERTERIEPGSPFRVRSDAGDLDSDYGARTTRIDDSTPLEDQEMTRVIGDARRRRRHRRAAPEWDRGSRRDAMDDPPSGWLVIVNGPGKGNALTLGYGMNSIGRAADERVCLDFGDDRISRKDHASITYDSQGRKFYVQQGRGRNLVYMEDEVVLTPAQLLPFAKLSIGETTLRFVPLCGESFDWSDLAEG